MVFLLENAKLLVLFTESLTKKAEDLLDNPGYFIDHEQVVLFVLAVRQRVTENINHLVKTEFEVERNLTKVFQNFSQDLKSIFDNEIGKIHSAVKIDEDALDCWDSYKIPLLELGYEALSTVKLSSLNEAENLMRKLDEARANISSAINQTITDLSVTPSMLIFPSRSKINTYVSLTDTFKLIISVKGTNLSDTRESGDDL